MPTNRDLEVKNPEILLKRIRAAFPNLTWSSYRYISHSWDHEVIILDEKIVFRFPNSSGYLTALRDEIALLDYLAASSTSHTRVRIPQYAYIADDVSFAGYDIIPGIELSEEVFLQLPEATKDEAANQLADFFSYLHTRPLSELHSFNVETADFKKEAQEAVAKSEQFLLPKMPTLEYKLIKDTLTECLKQAEKPVPFTLTHNDISPKHILLNKQTNSIGLIDFSDRALSDPSIDFFELLLYGKSFAEKVYEYYRGPKDEQFLNRAQLYLKRFAILMLIDSFETDKITYKDAYELFSLAYNR